MAAGGARAGTCSPSRIAQSATALQDARFALSQQPSHTGSDTAIPDETGHAIADVKSRLVDFITAYMNCQRTTSDPSGMQVDLSRLGWARDAEPPPAGADTAKADPTLHFEVRPFAGGLLGITAAFGVPCGADTLLMLFAEREDGWSEIMRIQSPPYRDLAHAFDAFDYDISPLDDSGHWFLIEKHLPATCVSVNTVIMYSVARPSLLPSKPRIVFTGHDPIFWGDQDFGRLSVNADGFTVRFHDHGDNADIVEIVRRFSVAGNIVQPVRHPAPD